jgi:hypothetical protein
MYLKNMLTGSHAVYEWGGRENRHGLAPGRVFADRPLGFFVCLPYKSAAPASFVIWFGLYAGIQQNLFRGQRPSPTVLAKPKTTKLPAPPGFGRHTSKNVTKGGRENRHGLAPGRVFADRPLGFFVCLPH